MRGRKNAHRIKGYLPISISRPLWYIHLKLYSTLLTWVSVLVHDKAVVTSSIYKYTSERITGIVEWRFSINEEMTAPFSVIPLKNSKLKFNARAQLLATTLSYIYQKCIRLLSYLHVDRNVFAGEMFSRSLLPSALKLTLLSLIVLCNFLRHMAAKNPPPKEIFLLPPTKRTSIVQ